MSKMTLGMLKTTSGESRHQVDSTVPLNGPPNAVSFLLSFCNFVQKCQNMSEIYNLTNEVKRRNVMVKSVISYSVFLIRSIMK